MRIPGKALLKLVLQHERAKTTGTLACSPRRAGLFLKQGAGGRGYTSEWVGLEGQLRRSAYPLADAVCRDHVQDLAFAPGTSIMVVGLWPFSMLLLILLPLQQACSYFQSLMVSCILLCRRKLQAPWERVPGPSLLQV